ncbi:FxsA family protein [Opitutales bacterium]|nr:FxsA family protein [Verrucomicrobiota bacterium]MDA9962248.1 FxsA family protein [Opitutales bacterium]
MFARLLILFITVPLIELYLLVGMGRIVGLIPTIGLVILTGFWGAHLARSQGHSILARMQREIQGGKVPTEELIEGVLVLIGGIVLLTPGLLTDLAGFALMIPSTRRYVRNRLRNRFAEKAKMHFRTQTGSTKNRHTHDDDVIDV